MSAYGLGPYPDPALHFGPLISVYTVVVPPPLARTAVITGAITVAVVVGSLLLDLRR